MARQTTRQPTHAVVRGVSIEDRVRILEMLWEVAYADGTPYKQIGTTCYAWAHQGEALETKTLQTLKAGPFNKIRMCVFPKWYAFNQVEPEHYAFEGTPPLSWDFTRFNPAFWRHLEQRIAQLRAGSGSYSGEHQLVTGRGALAWVGLTLSALQDSGRREVRQLIVVISDISA